MLHLTITLDKTISEEILTHLQQEVPRLIKESIYENPTILNNLIKTCVTGQIRQICNEVLQGKEIKQTLTEKVLEVLDV